MRGPRVALDVKQLGNVENREILEDERPGSCAAVCWGRGTRSMNGLRRLVIRIRIRGVGVVGCEG
jgi:hypothetical protein